MRTSRNYVNMGAPDAGIFPAFVPVLSGSFVDGFVLTNVFQSPDITVSLAVGFTKTGNFEFTIDDAGVYIFDIERIYEQTTQNPTNPVIVSIQIIVNEGLGSEFIITREIQIGAATGPGKPSISSYTSERPVPINAGDTMKVSFRAFDSVTLATVSGVTVSRAQISGHKISELPG